MTPLQLLGSEVQRPHFPAPAAATGSALQGGGSLANWTLQNQYLAAAWLTRLRRVSAPRVRRRREVEIQWRRNHAYELRGYAGQWVVLEKQEVVAASASLREAVKQARASGVMVPYVFRVDETLETVARIGL